MECCSAVQCSAVQCSGAYGMCAGARTMGSPKRNPYFTRQPRAQACEPQTHVWQCTALVPTMVLAAYPLAPGNQHCNGYPVVGRSHIPVKPECWIPVFPSGKDLMAHEPVEERKDHCSIDQQVRDEMHAE